MLRSANSLRDYHIRANDGNVGYVDDLLFDGNAWVVRYIVVDTSQWLPGRKVLLIPDILGAPSLEGQLLPVDLTRDQVKNSPEIDTDKPVARQKEIDLFEYYGWSPYWGGGHGGFAEPVMRDVDPDKQELVGGERPGDPHLRSMREVRGYSIDAADGQVGYVDDLIVEDRDWPVRYIAVDTKKWLSGGKVIVSPEWTERIDWQNHSFSLKLSREEVKNSPEYDPSQAVNREYETRVYDYYGRPHYWG
jgi:hypothetical protein